MEDAPLRSVEDAFSEVHRTYSDCHISNPRVHLPEMIRHDPNRIDPKRRATIDYKKKQFASPTYKQQDYSHRLNIYHVPPTAEIRLEDFEQWAIDRLRSQGTPSPNLDMRLILLSPRRAGGLHVPQQNSRRDSGPHETSP